MIEGEFVLYLGLWRREGRFYRGRREKGGPPDKVAGEDVPWKDAENQVWDAMVDANRQLSGHNSL